ncbi:MAG: YaiI/YqxD family protein [Gammaproteobacteria bacterium]|nr:YaiI/YqxD family protein [Gammaproteobacteria bacterium]
MKIWVDADACPKVIKEILFRVAERTKITVTLVANQSLSTPPSAFIKSIRVSSGFDVADNYIVQKANKDDLVITADIPLAAEVIEKGAHALNPRGELYSTETIKQKLVMRDLMDELRGSGEVTGGPPPLNQRDRREFANQLDRLVEKWK